MAAPKEILELVKLFESNKETYLSTAYNETQVRTDFIDPLFEALGWDVKNRQGHAQPYREVILEDSIRIGRGVKSPDMSFRIGGMRKFFVECKKPSVDLKDDPAPAHQLRSYAWSAKLPLSVLTDFHEFAVYDCRVRPAMKDKPAVARRLYIRYDEYATRWDEIASIFSRDAVLKGSFDRYAGKPGRGTKEVDDAFLDEIERWREILAKDIAKNNKRLGPRELNYAVQQTIDRVIFLRICEDRGIEPEYALKAVTNGANIYGRLFQLFQRADQRYNSGLFHFRDEKGHAEPPDEISARLKIGDSVLREIVHSLYDPNPWKFDVMPADILGQVYEQFLGKVIHLTKGHHAKIEEKPEVRKAGGVYYTPTYIVDYIVKNTVGKLLEGKTPTQAAKLRILDPACGSGSFLIGAYQCLVDWHRDWYFNHGPEKHRKELMQAAAGEWRLTTAEKKKILLNNLYGVDIDPQAVEVTKLSLLLKVLEGENTQTLQNQLKLFHERALPDLGSNIKCGNSLVGPDYYDGKQVGLFAEEEQAPINVFDWKSEFAEIMKKGGFDAVIGNPPWGATLSDDELEYLREHYPEVVARMIDSYIYFLARANHITKQYSPIGFIVPSTILNQIDARPTRELLINRGMTNVISLGQGIFGMDVLNTSTILVSANDKKGRSLAVLELSTLPLADRPTKLTQPCEIDRKKWEQLVHSDPHKTFFTSDLSAIAILDRLRKNSDTLADILSQGINRGVSPDVVGAHVVTLADAKKYRLEKALLRHSVSGAKIRRYQGWSIDQYIIYTTRDTPITSYPNVKRYLARFSDQNSCREVKEGKHPCWALHRPRNEDMFAAPKLIGLTTTRTIELIYDEKESIFVTDAMYLFSLKQGYDPHAVMAVLQSKLFLFLYRIFNQGETRVVPQVKALKLEPLPFPKTFFKSKITKQLRNNALRMYELNNRICSAKLPHAKTALRRQIDATDRQIDQLVYGLYGLTEGEIQIVEGSMT